MEEKFGRIVPKRPSNKEGIYTLDKKAVPGYVVVIVNFEFDPGNKLTNLTKGNDCDEIDKLFSTYGYRVRCFFNKNKDEILWIVGYYSRKIDSGSLICFISSHGYQTSLACPNGDYVQIFDILKMAKTQELDKRPKVFFFDACRLRNGSLNGKVLPEPPTSNYYVGFSCLDTKTSYIGNKSCGVYFEEIITVFNDGFPRPHIEKEKVRDLNHFMNKVNYAVTDKYGQVPTIRTTLVGKVFLQKPEYTEDVPKNTHVNVTPFDQRLSEI